MTHDEFRALYRLDERLAEGQVVTHRAREMDGDPVLVHFLVEDRAGSRTSLLNYLPKLDSAHAAQIRLLTEVDEVPVLVTDPLEAFTTLAEWLDQATQQGRKTDDPGVLTRILASAPPTGSVPPLEPEEEEEDEDAPTSLRLGETRLFQAEAPAVGTEEPAGGSQAQGGEEPGDGEDEGDDFEQTRLLTPDQVGQALEEQREGAPHADRGKAAGKEEAAPIRGQPGQAKGPGRPGAYTMVFGDSGGRVKTGPVEPPKPRPEPPGSRAQPPKPRAEPARAATSPSAPKPAAAPAKAPAPRPSTPRPPARKESSPVLKILGAIAAVLVLVIVVVVVMNMMR